MNMAHWIGTLGVACLLLGCGGGGEAAASTTPKAATSKVVLGYAANDPASLASAMSPSNPVTAVSMTLIRIDTNGNLSATLPPALLASNQAQGRQTYACVKAIGGHRNPDIAHSALVTNRATTLQNLVALAKAQNLAGINLDFEGLYTSDRDAYTSFVAELATQLHANGARLMVSVPPKSSDSMASAWTWPYDYAALGQSADFIQVMTYGQHTPSGAPGSVAGSGWMLKALQYAVSQMPANKILLGLPAFGYNWNLTAGTGQRVAYKDTPQLLASTGATPQWNASTQSAYFHYTDAGGSAHEVWYETPQGLQAKAAFANTLNLAGVSIWILGDEDASFWSAITTALQ